MYCEMRMLTKIIFISTFIGLFTTVYGQEVKVEIYYDSILTPQTSSSGERMIEYKGYDLRQILSKALRIPIQYFVINDTTLLKRTVSLKVLTKQQISAVNLEGSLIKAFNDGLGVTITTPYREVLTNVAYITNDQNLKKHNCLTDNGETRRTMQINRTWKGYCVTIQELLDKISEWSGESIMNETNNKNKYNLEVNHSEWDSMVNDLEFNYGIVISRETRKTKIVYVD